ncbi:UNVERIFIED_CONTAM: hypothetical protein K2H54_025510 [Gekko kuhli]
MAAPFVQQGLPPTIKGVMVLIPLEVLEDILDLDVSVSETEDFLQLVSGEKIVLGSLPLAHRYGGHQFGSWAGQLGDGRAHLIGVYTNRFGDKWELQLKGSGRTPYSRNGDGRAVLRSSVREFLGSEAMHHLGIPTSRAASDELRVFLSVAIVCLILALDVSNFFSPHDSGGTELIYSHGAQSLVVSDDDVWRDQFYNGDIKKERERTVTGSGTNLEITDRVHVCGKMQKAFFSVVVSETADLIALWMSVGFAHGVCNTDNFSLLSITIDYGPFGFMDSYDPDFVPNLSDDERRYKIGNQASVGMFNLNKLLQALNPLLDPRQKQLASQILEGYPDQYYKRFIELFKAKLGLLGSGDEDGYLIGFLLKLMEDVKADFTMTFRQLSEISLDRLKDFSISEQQSIQDSDGIPSQNNE